MAMMSSGEVERSSSCTVVTDFQALAVFTQGKPNGGRAQEVISKLLSHSHPFWHVESTL